MPRILILPLLLLFTTACSLAGATIAPQDAPDGQDGAQAVQASPTALILATAPRSVTQAATVDNVGTQAALLGMIATANAQSDALRDKLAEQNAAIEQAKAAGKQAEAETAKYNAANSASKASETQAQAAIAAGIARQKEADAKKAEAENERLKLAAEAENEKTKQLAIIIGGVVFLSFLVVVVWSISRRPRIGDAGQPAQNDQPPQSEFVERTIPAMGSRVRRETPEGVTTEEMSIFALNVRTSENKSGIPFTRSFWVEKNGMQEKKWDAINLYMADNGYTMPITEGANSALSITPAGESYLALFRDDPHSPVAETPISA